MQTEQKILVTGATGAVGRELIARLLENHAHVRALTRNAAAANLPSRAEIVEANTSDPATLDGAFEGVDAVFLTPRSTAGALEALLGLAREAGVRHAVLISALTVEYGGGEARFIDQFRAVEDAVIASGLECTILRCADFDANVRIWTPQIRSSNVVRGAYGSAATACIHERDIAEVAALALCNDGHAGATYALTGPQRISQIDKVREIGRAIGRDLTWQETPADQIRDNMIAAGVPEEIPARLLGYLGSIMDKETPLTDTVPRLLKREALSFAQWAREHFG